MESTKTKGGGGHGKRETDRQTERHTDRERDEICVVDTIFVFALAACRF